MKRICLILALVSLLAMTDVSKVSGGSLPDSAFISGFVGHAQSYAIDCEVRSAVDWAGFWGVTIGETEFLEALPRTDNPDVGFVGDPNDVWGRIPPHGYGVHADPVAKTLRGYGLWAEAQHNLSWDDLRHEIDAGRPVIVWIIGAMWDGTPVAYHASDGRISRVAAYEHTMTLVGYTSETVKVVDASTGYLDTYWLSDFLDSWAVLSNMAVIGGDEQALADDLHQATTQGDQPVTGQSTNQTSIQAADQSGSQGVNHDANQDAQQDTTPASADSISSETMMDTYTVQKGDYVMKIARRFGISWLELAQLNSLYYPYVIYTGQVLRLPAHETPGMEPGTSTTDTQGEITTQPNSLVQLGETIGIDWHLVARANHLSLSRFMLTRLY